MNKTLSWFALFILLFGNFSFALDLQSALKLSNDALKTAISSTGSFVQWGNTTTEDWIISILHEKGITIHTDWNSFKPNNDIRRDEAAKMLTLAVPYLPNGNKTSKASNVSCTFYDENAAWSDLKSIIKESCEKGLFKGSNWKFNPEKSITNAQLLTVLWRMLYGMQDETKGHYASKYIALLEKDWYLDNISMPQSKWDVAAERGLLAKLVVRVIE